MKQYRKGAGSFVLLLCFLTTILLNDQRSIARALTEAVDAYIDSLYAEGEIPSADLLAKETT